MSRDQGLAEAMPLTMPVLAIGAGSGDFTAATMKNAGATDLRSETLEGVGHYATMEAPAKIAGFIDKFVSDVAGS